MECTTIKIVLWVLNIILFIVLIRRSGLTLSGIREEVSSRVELGDEFHKAHIKAISEGKGDKIGLPELTETMGAMERRISALRKRKDEASAMVASRLSDVHERASRIAINKDEIKHLSRYYQT
ncbi:hypothetical protein EXVG_00377 [Emiliania huxleyi virus 202]|nr:hypothetical protein EXVG_00377 [Emiliania huxleyi virus 202]AHA54254.1 putative membrane protein [Emiliania huxleyi virus 18]AHA55302.1 putative membrane protein [Emiliania huxleyi virus 156]